MKPNGFQILVKMEEVSQEIEEGALAGFVLSTESEHKREQKGHDQAVVVSYGPLAYLGWDGCDAETAEGRAEQWGNKIGDVVEFNRYDGKELNHPGYENYRLISDKDIIAVVA
jgi:co-chaperonin GroES (HSP10)